MVIVTLPVALHTKAPDPPRILAQVRPAHSLLHKRVFQGTSGGFVGPPVQRSLQQGLTRTSRKRFELRVWVWAF